MINYLYHIIFGAILGSAFNLFTNVEMSWMSSILSLIGLSGLSFLPKTYRGFYLFGLAFNTVSLYWVGQALLFAPYTIGINLDFMTPFASFILGLIFAWQFPLALRIGGTTFWIVPFLLMDIARSYSSTFFPWNFIGYTSTLWLSSFRFSGIIGMNAFMLTLSQIRSYPRIFQIGLSILTIIMSVDHYFYQKHPVQFTNFTVKILQTNIPQDRKTSTDQIYRLMDISTHGQKTSFIIWPESIVLKCLYHCDQLRHEISKIIPDRSHLILGHIRFDQKLYVCISALNHKGDIVSTYDKQKLVPFGEYTPFFLRLPKLTHGKDPYSQGIFKQSLNITPRAAPLICYEDAFGFLLKNYPETKWIVSVSNDAWYGVSSGPYQHFHIARCRAIEARKPFVRSVNSGISGLIGPQGQVLAFIPFQKEGFLDVRLPKPL